MYVQVIPCYGDIMILAMIRVIRILYEHDEWKYTWNKVNPFKFLIEYYPSPQF